MADTFLHISDLHIGDVTLLGKRSYSDPQAVTMLNVYQYLPGNLGHSDLALRAVNGLYRQLRRDFGANGVSVIVTGDATAFGKQAHFATAKEFFDGPFVVGKRHRLDLSLNTRIGIIPGNHDYFAGNPVPIGHITGHFTHFFNRALPNCSWTVPLPDGRQLRFLEIDCDHDFELHGNAPRLTARSSGLEHLQALDAQLKKLSSAADEPRILLMHGSPTHQDGVLKICELMYNAHQMLDQFCAAHRVKAILCGHVHDRYLGPIIWPSHAANTVELRCGTTMQVLKPAINPATRLLIRRYLSRTNHALVHRIVQRDGAVYWETTEHFLRHKETKFQEASGTYSIQL